MLYDAHLLIWFMVTGEWPSEDEQVDHRDRDGLNNTWENLRKSSRNQNQYNRTLRSDNKSGFKGVRLHRDGKRWQARMTLNSRSIHIGIFNTAEAAARAYDAAARKHHGEFARPNFPEADTLG